jgi:hypothetical protein
MMGMTISNTSSASSRMFTSLGFVPVSMLG